VCIWETGLLYYDYPSLDFPIGRASLVECSTPNHPRPAPPDRLLCRCPPPVLVLLGCAPPTLLLSAAALQTIPRLPPVSLTVSPPPTCIAGGVLCSDAPHLYHHPSPHLYPHRRARRSASLFHCLACANGRDTAHTPAGGSRGNVAMAAE